MPVGIDPKVDYAFKWVFGREANSAILIDLLHAVLNPAPDEQIAGIELLDPFTEKGSSPACASTTRASASSRPTTECSSPTTYRST